MSLDDVAEAWRRRIDAMLAKAESTPYGPEAEALIAKAHQLMVRHSITESMLGDVSEQVGCSSILVQPPYAGARSSLLGAIASANGCRVVLSGGGRGPQRATVVGQATDRCNTLAMFAWLSLYAGEAMAEAHVPLWESPRRFRHAFLLAFACRIGERLCRATTEVEHAGAGRAMGLVLRDRADAVDAYMDSEFSNLRRMTRTATSAAGASSGRSPADRAGLTASVDGSARPEVTGGER